MKRRLMLLLFTLCFCWFSLARAATFDFPDYLSDEQTVGDDVYMFGETIAVKGKVIGDLITVGKNVAYSGAVAADLLAIGLEIEADGNINDDIRAAGLSTNFRGNVGDDAVLTGFKVNISPDSRIGHTAVVAAGQAVINGQIQGDLLVTGYDCIVGGNIQGSITASTAKLQLTPTARIKGNLIYTCQEPLIIPPGAIIEGEVIHQKTAPFPFAQEAKKPWGKLIRMLTWDASLSIIGICLLLLLPQTIHKPRAIMLSKPGLSCVYGLLWLVGAPITAAIGIFTIIGLPLSLAIAFLYVSSLYLSSLPVALWIGQQLFRTQYKPYLSLITGLLIISVLRSLPYVGLLSAAIILIIGLGAFALSFRNYVWGAGSS